MAVKGKSGGSHTEHDLEISPTHSHAYLPLPVYTSHSTADFRLGPFSNDVRELSFNVSIEDDMIPEENEEFTATLTLSPADQARFGNFVMVAPDLASITIMDDDGECPALSICRKILLREVL